MKGTKMSCRLYFVNSDDILTPNHLKYYFYVSNTASLQLACQMHFIFVDKFKKKITFIFSDRICGKVVGEEYATYFFLKKL